MFDFQNPLWFIVRFQFGLGFSLAVALLYYIMSYYGRLTIGWVDAFKFVKIEFLVSRIYSCHRTERTKIKIFGMSRHQYDLVVCMKQPGAATGLLCEKCDGKCPVCDSLVHPKSRVRICDSCAFGKFGTMCIICNSSVGVTPAYYCWECCKLGRDRDGCPRILNVGSNRLDRHFEKKRSKWKQSIGRRCCHLPSASRGSLFSLFSLYFKNFFWYISC